MANHEKTPGLSEIFDRLSKIEKTLVEIQSKSDKKPFLEEFGNSITGIIGLQEALTQKNLFLKFIWMIILLFGSGATVYFVYQTTSEYYEHPTGIMVSWDRQDYEYPPLTLCADVLLDTENINLSWSAFQYSLGYIDYFYLMIPKSIPDQSKAKKEFLNFYQSQSYKNLRHYFKHMITNITEENDLDQDSTSIRSSYSCSNCDGSIKKKIMADFFCYSFQLQPSYSNISSILPKQLTLKIKKQTKNLLKYKSWILKLGSPIDTLFTPITYLKSNYYNFLKIKVEKIVSLNKPEHPCDPTDSRFDSREICLINCYDRVTFEGLKCRLMWFSLENNTDHPTNMCNTFETKMATNGSIRDFILSSLGSSSFEGQLANQCMKKCQVKCKRTSFSVTLTNQISLTDYDPDKILNTNGANMDTIEVELRDEAILDGSIVTFTEYSKISTIDFISNVGGMLGLFVGATLMTFIQFILFFIEYLMKKWR